MSFSLLTMSDLVHLLSIILPIIASTLLIAVISLNFYIKIRRNFAVSVNCWFCNSWTKVAYDDRNSFDCPKCLQYNGFNKDGDYNKIIPEQHDELMNNKSTRIQSNKAVVSTRLCALCNNNQQLKIIQLANFVPMVEDNYDNEIEHFQQQLEKAYKLCKKCDSVLKTTIKQQNAWLFGKHVKNIVTNGISSLNYVSKNLKQGKQPVYARIIEFLSIVLVAAVFCLILFNNKLFVKYIPKEILRNVGRLTNKTSSMFLTDLPKIKVGYYSLVSCLGLLLQLVSFVIGQYPVTVKMNRLLCWTILLLLSWIKILRNYTSYILVVQAFCCLYLMYSSYVVTKRPKKPKYRSKTKSLRSFESTCSEISEASDFEDISTSSKYIKSPSSTASNESLDYLNKSTNSSPKSQFYINQSVPMPNRNFNTATSVLNNSFGDFNSFNRKTQKQSQSVDLNKSLNNLHLDLNFVPPSRTTSPVFSVTSVNNIKRPKPVLSPPKLQSFNQNSWVAGGFWRNLDGVTVSTNQRSNISRSSSESSGFGSQHNELNSNYVAPQRNEFEFSNGFNKSPIPSPCVHNNYTFTPINSPRVGNTYYPDLQQNNMLFLHSASPSLLSPRSGFSEPYQRKSLFKQNWGDHNNLQSFDSVNLMNNQH